MGLSSSSRFEEVPGSVGDHCVASDEEASIKGSSAITARVQTVRLAYHALAFLFDTDGHGTVLPTSCDYFILSPMMVST